MKIIKAIIGEIKKSGEVKYDVSFMPDNKTWITIDSRTFGVPRIGDIIEIRPPEVINLIRDKRRRNEMSHM